MIINQLSKRAIIIGGLSLCCIMLTSCDNYASADNKEDDIHSEETSGSHMPFAAEYGYASENGITAHLTEDDTYEDPMCDDKVILLPMNV